MRWHDRKPAGPLTSVTQRHQVMFGDPRAAHRHHRTNECTNHRVTEGVRLNRRRKRAVISLPPLKPQQLSYGRCPFARLTKCREVLQTKQPVARPLHHRAVEFPRYVSGEARGERVPPGPGSTQAILVSPGQGPEPSVKRVRHDTHLVYDHISRALATQQPIDPARGHSRRQLSTHIKMSDLAPRMYPRISSTANGESMPLCLCRGRTRLQQCGESRLQLTLHGAQPWLRRPPMKIGSVIPEVETQSHALRLSGAPSRPDSLWLQHLFPAPAPRALAGSTG